MNLRERLAEWLGSDTARILAWNLAHGILTALALRCVLAALDVQPAWNFLTCLSAWWLWERVILGVRRIVAAAARGRAVSSNV